MGRTFDAPEEVQGEGTYLKLPGTYHFAVNRIVDGEGRPEDLDKLDDVASKIEGRTICALGDAAAMPVRSFVKRFRPEFEHYIETGKSIFHNESSEAA